MPRPACKVLFILPAILLWLSLAASANPKSTSGLDLEKDWKIQSSCKLTEKSGSIISSRKVKTTGWIPASVPTTVLAAQLAAGEFSSKFKDPFYGMNLRLIPGTDYPIGKIFTNLSMSDGSPYKCSWWYRTEFTAPANFKGKNIWLHFDGINYRANIWLNGKKIADSNQVAGAYRRYEFSVKAAIRPGKENVLAVETFAQTETDLGINFVDWNPAPADKSLGIWRKVFLTTSGPVTVRYPTVTTHFPDASLEVAELTAFAELQNATDRETTGMAEASLDSGPPLTQQVTLGPREHKTVVFSPEQFPQLRVEKPQLWWPYGLGPQMLHNIDVQFRVKGRISDRQSTRFGIREITAAVNPKGYKLFKINGRNILIRGGGWAPDMFLRVNRERMADELRYVRDLGLNTIRLEGKLETDDFFDMADEMGILVMAGWCCCDHWEHWNKWKPEDHEISRASLASQIQRLRSHPSLLVWLNGSDGPPPADVETDYINVLKGWRWPNPFISSASAKPAALSGPSGVKMSGPYDYVPPSYWLRDDSKYGGAYGFNTETSPGPAIPPPQCLEKFLPKENLWPQNDVWNFHAGLGSFAQTNIFNSAMAATYGAPKDIEDYTRKAQAMAYDGERAMFEAYARNKYNSTGVIQWMLNNAWPSTIWHLYDYYLVPAGGYFGSKKALEPLHAQYSYDDRSVVVVNNAYKQFENLKVNAKVYDLNLREKFSQEQQVTVESDGIVRAFTIPDSDDLGQTYFVKLSLSDGAGKLVSSNFYWLPKKLDELDWGSTKYFYTPATQYADMTGLAQLPTAQVEYSAQNETRGADQVVAIRLRNPGNTLAFMVHPRILAGTDGDDVAPVLWDDNYVSLLPGESRTVTATFRAHDLRGSNPKIIVEGWNVAGKETTAGGKIGSNDGN
jgi:exo-1,4-beta-D-glucosaminidase